MALSPVMQVGADRLRSLVTFVELYTGEDRSRSRCGTYVRADGTEPAVLCNPAIAVWPARGTWDDVAEAGDLELDFQ